MNKIELVEKLKSIYADIARYEYYKELAKEKLMLFRGDGCTHIDYALPYAGQTAWNIKIPIDTIEDALVRISKFPAFEMYYINIHTIATNDLSDLQIYNTDLNNIELLKYRICRNIIIHDNWIVKQKHIDEFDRMALEYNSALSQNDLFKAFNHLPGNRLLNSELNINKFIRLVNRFYP